MVLLVRRLLRLPAAPRRPTANARPDPVPPRRVPIELHRRLASLRRPVISELLDLSSHDFANETLRCRVGDVFRRRGPFRRKSRAALRRYDVRSIFYCVLVYWCLLCVFGALRLRFRCVFFCEVGLIFAVITYSYVRFPCVCFEGNHAFRFESLQKGPYAVVGTPIPSALELPKCDEHASNRDIYDRAADTMSGVFPCRFDQKPEPCLTLTQSADREMAVLKYASVKADPAAHATPFCRILNAIMKARISASVSGQTLPGRPRLPTVLRRSNSRPLSTIRQNVASLMPVSDKKYSISFKRFVCMSRIMHAFAFMASPRNNIHADFLNYGNDSL